MWKKLLSILALVGMLSAQTASAAGGGEIDPVKIVPLVSSMTVSPSTINPSANEAATVTVSFSAQVYAYANLINSSTGSILDSVFSSQLFDANKTYTFTYTGLVDKKAVADGAYKVHLVAATPDHAKSSFVDRFLTITSTSIGALTVSSFTVTPTSFNPSVGELLDIQYTLSKTADTVKIDLVNSVNTVISTYTAINEISEVLTWNGRDTDNKVVANGSYKAVLTATLGETIATKEAPFTVTTGKTSTVIINISADPNPWDPSDEDLEINWELAKDVEDFTLVAKKVGSGKEIELTEDSELDSDEYKFEWNGLDGDDDYIVEGMWELLFTADKEEASYFVKVKYESPEIHDDMFVSKTPFDNSIDEFTYVVFRLDQKAEVTVDVMKGGKKIDTLMDEEELNKNVWYAVRWDGTDDDSDEVDEGTYSFKVTAANVANDKVKSIKPINVKVEEDTVSSGKSNVTNDFIVPVIVEKTTTEGAEISYKIDEDAEVTVAIYKGSKSSDAEIVLEKDVERSAGEYTVQWDGRDDNGKKLEKNVKYSYLVTAKTSGSSSKTDKERGYFVIGTEGTVGNEPTPKPKPGCEYTGFWDVSSSSPYCEAIAWVYDEGIFEGYPDGSFKQYNFINRVEALKVVLTAFGTPILPDDYTDLGWDDTIVGSWYMKYLRTGKFYGMVSGDKGTSFVRPDTEINRVEVLRYVIEAAEKVSMDLNAPACDSVYYSDVQPNVWYSDYICIAHDYDLFNTYSGYFYPGNKVTRGEVALLLYRLDQAGLLK